MAATNINRVVLTGNLTRDPELRSTSGGTPVCSLRIATQHAPKDANGEWGDARTTSSVTVLGAQGENCARFLSKGRPVAIDGRLQWREWQDQNGNKRESDRDRRGERPVPRRARRRGRQRQRLHAALRRPRRHARLRARRHPRRRRRQQHRRRRRHSVLRHVPAAPPTRGRRLPFATLSGCRAPVPAARIRALKAAREVFERGKAAQPADAPARSQGRARQRAPQVLPVLPRQGRVRRLQGHHGAAEVHLRPREDPLAADHRGVPPASEPDRHGRQARPRAGAAPVRRRYPRVA